MNEQIKLTREALMDMCRDVQDSAEREEMIANALLRELEEKSDAEEFRTPKEIVDYDDPTARFYLFTCPTCGYHLSEGMKYYKAYDYCPHCGQAIKWPEVEE